MPKINNIYAREVLDSRGSFTIETEVILDGGFRGAFITPSGMSKGEKEAVAINCIDAVENSNKIIKPEILGMNSEDQELIDKKLIELDGTKNKSSLGANAILGISMATFIANAKSKSKQPYEFLQKPYILPTPYINIINGGEHAQNSITIQEFMIVPQLQNFSSFKNAMKASAKIFKELKTILQKKNLSTAVGDEGGFAPNLEHEEDALKFIIEAIEQSNLIPGKDIFIALDAAANSFYSNNKYKINKTTMNAEQLINYYQTLTEKYHVISIEDPLSEHDREGWIKITKSMGEKIQIVGDDIFATNSHLLAEGINDKIGNCALIKPNQIGTLTETIETMNLAKKNNYATIVSHRSGDSEDTIIAHIAFSALCGSIKTGSVCRSERTAKYNEIIRIEEILNQKQNQ